MTPEARSAQRAPGRHLPNNLSGVGKTTLAMILKRKLFEDGCQIFVLDGDNLRRSLNAGLGFSPEGRAENLRRVGKVAALFPEAGVAVIAALMPTYAKGRAIGRRMV